MYEAICANNGTYQDTRNADDVIRDAVFYFRHLKSVDEYRDITDRLCREFFHLSIAQIKSLPKTILHSIITNPKFKKENEDQLYEIIKAVEEDEERNENEDENEEINLYELIYYSKLSLNNLKDFLTHLDYRELTHDLWCRIVEIIIANHGLKENERRSNEIRYDGNSEHRLLGIIHHMIEEAGSNVSSQSVIDVTASSIDSQPYAAKNAVDFDNKDNFYASKDDTFNQWLQYDFKTKKIRPTKYSIRTRSDCDSCNPQNWVIEVSNTGKENDWRIIDTRTNVTSISKRSQIDTFDIETQLTSNESYRFIRLRQTGKSTNNYNYLVISALEYFGYLVD